MALETFPYDVADYLTSDEMVVSYLAEELHSGELFYMAEALGAVARARGGVAQLAHQTNLCEEDIRRAIDSERPDKGVILQLMGALGVPMQATQAA